MPTGYSLHIGLNYVDPNKYVGKHLPLQACINDANAMLEIAKNEGYQFSTKILNEQATRDNTLNKINEMSTLAQAGDIFFLTYSGHGGTIENDDPDDYFTDETWCLYDGELLDNEIFAAFKKFNKDVRIFVISDSCHSGTVVLSGEINEEVQNGFKEKSRPKEIGGLIRDENRDTYDNVFRQPQVDKKQIDADVLLLAGCQDDGKSYEGLRGYGVLTENILQTWNDGSFQGDYTSFYRIVTNKIHNLNINQNPNLYMPGIENEVFMRQKPFSI